MNIGSKIIQGIMIDISCLVAIGMLLIVWQMQDMAGTRKRLEKALVEGEELIAYAVEKDTAYAFVSTTGDKKYGDRFLVLNRQEKEEWERFYENNFVGLKPWKLSLSDIDGDGEQELLTAVLKTTHYDKEEKNRLFIFNYRNGKLIKKWTGSDIAGRWENFITGELVNTKGEEIIFITEAENGQEKLLVYHWFDFGFLMLAQSEHYNDIVDAEIAGENQIRIIYIDKTKTKKRERLQLRKGNMLKLN